MLKYIKEKKLQKLPKKGDSIVVIEDNYGETAGSIKEKKGVYRYGIVAHSFYSTNSQFDVDYGWYKQSNEIFIIFEGSYSLVILKYKKLPKYAIKGFLAMQALKELKALKESKRKI